MEKEEWVLADRIGIILFCWIVIGGAIAIGVATLD
jgi:hypothetical protein